MKKNNKKTNPDWIKYWDNVNLKLYALVKQVKKFKKS